MNKRLLVTAISLVLLGTSALWPVISQAVQINNVALQVTRGYPAQDGVAAIPARDAALASRVRELLAVAALKDGRREQGIAYLKAALPATTRHNSLLILLVAAYRSGGQTMEARHAVRQLSNPDSVIVANCQYQYVYQKDPKEIEFWCPMLEESTQLAADGKCLLGFYQWQAQRLDAAETAWRQAVTDPGVKAECLNWFGDFLRDQTRFGEARKLYERAYAQKPIAHYLWGVARTYAAEGDAREALKYYQQAIPLISSIWECGSIWGGIGGIYYDYDRDYVQAANAYRKAIECNPDVDVSIYRYLAASERNLQHPEAAIAAYQAMHKRLVGSSYQLAWRHEYATYLAELGRNDEARRIYQSILDDAPDDQVAKDALD